MNLPSNPTTESQAAPRKGDRASAVVCAALMAHAPVLVPDVGGARGRAAEGSYQAMREVAACVLGHRPETLVVISPHSPRKPRAFGLWTDDRLHGSFAQFAAPQAQVNLPNDRRMAEAIAAEAQARNLATWQISNRSLDHGALVPLWFLAEAGWAGPTVILSLNHAEDGGLTSLGEAIAAAANKVSRRVAIIASGDMSHRLTANAPCGFHPQAHQFDEHFIHLVRAGDYRAIQNINPELREIAAEDAVDSTLIAAAAVGWNARGHKVLGYEGPFGVGYGVAILFSEKPDSTGSETSPSCAGESEGAALPGLARRSVEEALRGSSELPPAASSGYLAMRSGVFVTARERDGQLRGCVGTTVPVCANLVAETWRSARLAALQDARFPPVMADELVNLRFQVSVIHSIENISSVDELQPQRHGVIVSANDGRRGVLLPGLENLKTGLQQVVFARKKGKIRRDELVKIQRFQVDRFEEPA